jgi:hypothetical protein
MPSDAAAAMAGGGFVWDAVLEYRVWCHPEHGATDLHDGDDYFYSFVTYSEALEFSTTSIGAEEPISLILQEEYIDEPVPGVYIHIRAQRIAEWPVEYLSRPKRMPTTIPDFMSRGASGNR